MSPRKDDIGDIDGLEAVEGAWRDLGNEAPPDLVDQAVLNRARLAVEKPQRPWTFNLTWVHGLVTMGVAALTLTMFLELRDLQPEAESPATFEVSLQKSVAERKDEDAAVGAQNEERRSLSEELVQAPADATPEYEVPTPLAEAPAKARSQRDQASSAALPASPAAPSVDERDALLDQAAVAASRSPEIPAKQDGMTGKSAHEAPEMAGRESRQTQAMSIVIDNGLDAARAAPLELEEGESLIDALLQPPLYPSLERVWPKDPDQHFVTVCRLSGAVSPAGCESVSFAEAQFELMRHYRQVGDAERLDALLARFREHYPTTEIPTDITE